MKKYLFLIGLFFPACIFAVWICLLAKQVAMGQSVRIEIEGYDPRDLLAGHYILYQNNWESVQERTKQTLCRAEDFSGSHRFYIPQEYASQLDRLFSTRRRYKFEVEYSCNEGKKPIAKNLLINGVNWREFINSQTIKLK